MNPTPTIAIPPRRGVRRVSQITIHTDRKIAAQVNPGESVEIDGPDNNVAIAAAWISAPDSRTRCGGRNTGVKCLSCAASLPCPIRTSLSFNSCARLTRPRNTSIAEIRFTGDGFHRPIRNDFVSRSEYPKLRPRKIASFRLPS